MFEVGVKEVCEQSDMQVKNKKLKLLSFVVIDALVLVRFLCSYGATSPAFLNLVKTKNVQGRRGSACEPVCLWAFAQH